MIGYPLSKCFQLNSGLSISFQHNSFRKNLIPRALFCWNARRFLREMDQNINFVEPLVTATRIWSS